MKKKWVSLALMIVYWSVYLTVTMALFERFGVVPHNVPLGFFGWTVFVELPRVIVGSAVGLLIFRR
jgi:hypothetical protein